MSTLPSDLAAKASTQELHDAIATREPTITALAQSRVANLVSDLAAKASSAALTAGLATKENTISDGSLPQSRVANLVSDLAAKASSAALTGGLATKENAISDGSLPQSRVANLVSDLSAKASSTALTAGLAAKQNVLTTASSLSVDTISSRLYLGEVFRFWAADQSSALLTIANNALGAEFAMPIRAPQLYIAQYCGIGVTIPKPSCM